MSKLGKLAASILIDNGSTLRPYFGPADPITGRVVLRYNPATRLFGKDPPTADLFGPLRINVILVGQIYIRVRRDRDHSTYHGETLFAQPFHVYDGPFQAQVNLEYTFPFEARFPDSGNNGSARLPPTFAAHFSDYPDTVDVSVFYQLGVKMEMPGIDIKMNLPQGESAPQVRYDLPRPPLSFIETNRSTKNHLTTLQTENLLPAHSRPTGFKQKAKAVFTSSHFPLLALIITFTDQKNIHPGQTLTFDIRLERDANQSTNEINPDMTLETFRADLKAYVTIDASSRMIGSSQCHDSRIVQYLNCTTPLPIGFRKEWSTTVTTGPVGSHISSFEHFKVSRVYVLKVTMQFKIAGKSVKVVKECPVTMLPPPVGVAVRDSKVPIPVEEDLPPPIEAGPSGTQGGEDEEMLPPPRYEEAGSSKLLKSG